MKLLEKILLPTKFTDGCRDTLKMAIHTAKMFNSEIIPMFVMTERISSNMTKDMLYKRALAQLEASKTIIVKNGTIAAEPVIVSGCPFDQIIRQSIYHDINVIMMGSGDKEETELYPLGITAQKVIRKSRKPVWLVKPGSSPTFTKILCPVDFSDTFRRALKNAIHLVRIFQVTLTVATVIQSLESLFFSIVKISDEEQETHNRQHLEKFQQFLKEFDFHKVNWNKQVYRGKPDREILRHIRKEKTDLLVMGSVGKTWYNHGRQ